VFGGLEGAVNCPRAFRHTPMDVRPPRTHALRLRVFLMLFFIY